MFAVSSHRAAVAVAVMLRLADVMSCTESGLAAAWRVWGQRGSAVPGNLS